MGSFTVALLEALLSAGVSPERARNVVDLFDRSVDERYSLHAQVLATKRDVSELETRLTREIAETRAQIAQVNSELGTRIAQINGELSTRISQINGELSARISQISGELGARIAESRSDLIKWTLAALTAQTALLVGALKLL